MPLGNDIRKELERHAKGAAVDIVPQPATFQNKVIIGAITLDCEQGSDDAQMYLPYIALLQPARGSAAVTPKKDDEVHELVDYPVRGDLKQPGGTTTNSAIGGSASIGAESKVAIWPPDPVPQLSPAAALPPVTIPPSMHPDGGGGSQLYHLRLRSFQGMSSQDLVGRYEQWLLSEAGANPKKDRQGRLVLQPSAEVGVSGRGVCS